METLDLVEAMGRPGFYPHRLERVELVETHISWVFLAGPLVYKVKKPVVSPSSTTAPSSAGARCATTRCV